MVAQIVSKLQNLKLLLQFAGPKVFLKQIGMHLYTRDTCVGFVKDLSLENAPVQARITYNLRPGTEEDMNEVISRLKYESKSEVIELLDRKSFYDRGFDCFFVARTTETNEICHTKWFVTSKYNSLLKSCSRLMIDHLKDDEVLTEYTYTFEKFRKTRVGAAVRFELSEMFREKGFKRVIGYASKNNPASLRSFEIDGYKRFEEVQRLKFLFITRRKHIHIDSAADIARPYVPEAQDLVKLS
jgi:hypothetical protein